MFYTVFIKKKKKNKKMKLLTLESLRINTEHFKILEVKFLDILGVQTQTKVSKV